ncbi:Dyp-type peroxidase [Lacihabitans sp. LS3-19]|uniref:Dyp-type peroxidase n=1 Tax=Lacihabitans sp. LS3-19 TaxID=2487335 RepID=UPI0020CCAE02|nr:Dyp-type peroxidase [Lacihabitans sp. LS3-19]MCP9768784.1 Dyp-type peroxidase [Lacihabitans sp. LS3-19]
MAINYLDPKHRQTLSDIQGNILKSHGREHTANLFIEGRLGEEKEVKNWLNSLVNEGIIKSGYEQLYATHLWKTQRIDGGLFACIHISRLGYDYLFDPLITEDKFLGKSAFLNGMEQAGLDDPDKAKWGEGYQQNIHFHLLIGDNEKNKVEQLAAKIKNEVESFATVHHIEFGDAIKNREGAGLEHFGYVDGISQPLFFEDEIQKYRDAHGESGKLKFDPTADLKLVLTPDPFFTTAQGSFFVFRKLEQNVQGFKKAEEKLADNLHLKGDERERVGAMIMGRFEDGTPIQMSEHEGLIANSSFNNFDYSEDEQSKCPYHAHIRKTNPRSDISDSKSAIMARRGIPFGERLDDMDDGIAETKPLGGVGLLFQSYQASIEAQFERIQKQWANDKSFPKNALGINDGNDVGLDLIIGQKIGQDGYPSESSYFKKWGDKNSEVRMTFDQFVTMKGGEYFFAPSIPFLKTLK